MSGNRALPPAEDRAVAASPSSPSVSPLRASIPSARPTRRDPSIKAAAIAQLARECLNWSANEHSLPEWTRALERQHLDDNGYELARELERYDHISPDPELVEILDGASHYLWTAHRDAVIAWAVETNWQPTHAVGDRFETRHGRGFINAINETEAIYLFVPDKDADSPSYAHGGGFHITDEELASAQAIDARRAETGTGSVHESAVRDSECAHPSPSSDTSGHKP